MRFTRPVLGKILQNAEGLGTPSPDTVRRRAQELALIEGRPEYNEHDWKCAFRELHGGHHETGDENGPSPDDEMLMDTSERDMVAPTLGHHSAPKMDGGENVGEELIAEGLDEAVHNQMLEARRVIDIPDGEEEVESGGS